MEKELEALKRIETVFPLNKQGKQSIYREYTNSVEPYYNDFNLVLKALTELKQIKEAKPSEAMEDSLKLYKMVDSAGNGKGFNLNEAWKYHKTIKQALLKVQEQEKVLEIIKEKDVNIWYLTVSTKIKNCKDYNSFLMNDKNKRQLTEEEFDLLKRYYENE